MPHLGACDISKRINRFGVDGITFYRRFRNLMLDSKLVGRIIKSLIMRFLMSCFSTFTITTATLDLLVQLVLFPTTLLLDSRVVACEDVVY